MGAMKAMKAKLKPRAKSKAAAKRAIAPVASAALFIRAAGEAAASAGGKGKGKTRSALPALQDDPRFRMGTFLQMPAGSPTPLRIQLATVDPQRADTQRLSILRTWSASKNFAPSACTRRRVMDLLDALFLEGGDSQLAVDFVTSVKQRVPEVEQSERFNNRLGKALQSWPTVAMEPQLLMPEEAVFAVIGDLLSRNRPLMAGSIFVQLTFYLRPGEVDDMRAEHIFAPPNHTAVPLDQYGIWLDSQDWPLMLDGAESEDLLAGQTLEVLKTKYGNRIWNFSSDRMDREFRCSLEALRLHVFGWTRYSLRFAGVLADLHRNRRSKEKIQQRGRWLSPESVPVLRPLHQQMDTQMAEYGRQIRENLPEYLEMPRRCPRFHRN